MFCWESVERINEEFGRIDILVNNAAEQHEVDDPADLETEQLERTFRTNVFSFFHMTRACLQYMQSGSQHHQHDVDHGLSRAQDADRLRLHQGRDRRVHALAVGSAGREGHSRERASRRGRSGPR